MLVILTDEELAGTLIELELHIVECPNCGAQISEIGLNGFDMVLTIKHANDHSPDCVLYCHTDGKWYEHPE